jgi:hypothetical protein
MIGGAISLRTEHAPQQSVGVIAYATGGYTLSNGDSDQLYAGVSITTSAQGRVLIRLDGATTMRLDTSTRATLLGPYQVHLDSGRLYVDSHATQNSTVTPDLSVSTTHARISKLGTQFEVVSDDDQLMVAVREGQVKVAVRGDAVTATAVRGVGDLLKFDGERLLSKTAVASVDARWAWTQQSRPRFDHESGSLYDYLIWYTRESGLVLRFEPGLSKSQAQSYRDLVGQADATQQSLEDALAAAEAKFKIKSGESYELVIGIH